MTETNTFHFSWTTTNSYVKKGQKTYFLWSKKSKPDWLITILVHNKNVII